MVLPLYQNPNKLKSLPNNKNNGSRDQMVKTSKWLVKIQELSPWRHAQTLMRGWLSIMDRLELLPILNQDIIVTQHIPCPNNHGSRDLMVRTSRKSMMIPRFSNIAQTLMKDSLLLMERPEVSHTHNQDITATATTHSQRRRHSCKLSGLASTMERTLRESVVTSQLLNTAQTLMRDGHSRMD